MIARFLGGFALGAVMLANVSNAQMRSQGQFQVSESGAATYSIPMQLPPGISGVEPQLSLNYSSQAGNGLLGLGWSMGGLGAIARCPQTIAQDGARRGVNYDLSDRYCLDGQRLIAISGSEGGDGTEYRTERESFARIVSYGNAGNGPAWFKVWSKSGQAMEYGRTSDARIEATGKTSVRTWALNRIEDTKGNFLTVAYQRDIANGDYYPSRIDYTGNSKANKAPTNSVLFQYEDRPDVVPLYRAGAMAKNTVRLKSVTVNADSVQVKAYTITYKNDGASYSRVSNVSECAGTVCRGEFRFDWTSGVVGFREAERFDTGFTPGAGWFDPGIQNRVWIVDVNGDGLPDILGATDSGLYWQLNTGNGFGPAQRADTGFRPSFGWFDPGIQNRVWIVDVNGDGLPDILGATDSGLYWQLNTGNGFGPAQRADTGFTPGAGWFDPGIQNRVWIVDVNGDGLPDILGATDSGLYWQLNTGNGFGPTQRADTGFRPSFGWFDRGIQNRVWIADVNGDGLPDILGATDSGLYWQLNTGNGFGPAQRADTTFRPSFGWFDRGIQNRVWIADVNGDGTSSIVGATDSGLYVQRNTTATKTAPNLISLITDEVGATVNIAYAPLTNKNTYTKDAPVAAYPIQDVQLPTYVAASVSSSNGSGAELVSRYTYGGLKADSTGRGLLGFRWVKTTQVETGLTSYTEYQQAWPYTGLPILSKKTATGGGNGGVLSQTVSTYACNDATSTVGTPCVVAPGKRYFVYAKQSVESNWDYNGATLPVITTSTEYDNWGNATKVDVSTDDGFKKSTINSYSNDSTNWYLGRLLRSSVTSTSP